VTFRFHIIYADDTLDDFYGVRSFMYDNGTLVLVRTWDSGPNDYRAVRVDISQVSSITITKDYS